MVTAGSVTDEWGTSFVVEDWAVTVCCTIEVVSVAGTLWEDTHTDRSISIVSV